MNEKRLSYLKKQFDKIHNNMWVCVSRDSADSADEIMREIKYGRKPLPVPNHTMLWVHPNYLQFVKLCERKEIIRQNCVYYCKKRSFLEKLFNILPKMSILGISVKAVKEKQYDECRNVND
jgi:hypothetical protein